jgi:hypothetical protein
MMQSFKRTLSTLFGRHSKKVWRAFFTSVPARLWGVITIPLVGHISGAYQVTEFGSLLRAVALYATLGFAWALFIEFQWTNIQNFFVSNKKKDSHGSN